MKINNKEFREWTADDLQVLLNNDAYRENNFIDYKVNFAPLIDKDKKREKQAEFRNDVCSFANADGGYIFYGIGENSGAASILAGISIPNIDRFELDRRNELQAIRPTVPEVDFSFIPIQDGKYVVVLYIQRGLYKPYITEEPEGQFHFYIRHGNKKQAMSYTEIRNGFLNAAMLSEDIKSFRKERLEEHITEMKKPFALVQVIPATFRSDYVPMYDMYREGKLDFDNLFNGMIRDRAVPNVDGVYFPDYSKLRDFEKLQIFNNGTVELKIDFEIREQNSKSQQLKTERYLIIFDFVEELKNLIYGTSTMYRKLGRSRGKSSGFPLSFLHPHFNIFHLFPIGDFLRAGIIAGGEAAKQYKSLQAEKYNEYDYDQKRHPL